MKPLSVAILGTRGYPSTYGGFETFVRRLAPWLVQRGHTVTVYGHGGRVRSEEIIDGVRVVDSRGVNLKSAATTTHGLTAAVHCLRHPPDVGLVLNVANAPAVLTLRAARIPTVVNVDGLEWERGKWGRPGKAAFRLGAWLCSRFASRLVADSATLGDIWYDVFGVQPEFIPYGADLLDARPAFVQEVGLEPGTYVLAVARLVPENNVEVLLDVVEAGQLDHTVVVVGSANYPNPTEARLADLQRRRRIIWLGHVADQELLSQLWANCGVYFHGHSVGGTNPALLQAMGAGAAIVATDTGFNREVLGSTGLYVRPRAEFVAAALDQLTSDDGLRRQLGASARRRAADHYDWESVLVSYERLLMAVANSATNDGSSL